MEFGWEFFWTVAASSTGTAALIAVAAFLFRGQISHWLSKDLEKIKAGHQRELEAYKVSLIADSERVKATQEVRKGAALKILEKKFAAIDRLHKAMESYVKFCAAAKCKLEHRREDDFTKLISRLNELVAATGEIGVFITADERGLLSKYRSSLTDYLPYCQTAGPLPSPEVLAKLDQAALGLELQIDGMIRTMLTDMQTLA